MYPFFLFRNVSSFLNHQEVIPSHSLLHRWIAASEIQGWWIGLRSSHGCRRARCPKMRGFRLAYPLIRNQILSVLSDPVLNSQEKTFPHPEALQRGPASVWLDRAQTGRRNEERVLCDPMGWVFFQCGWEGLKKCKSTHWVTKLLSFREGYIF